MSTVERRVEPGVGLAPNGPGEHGLESAVPRGLVDGPVYLDYNATTPVDPRVVAAMLPYFDTHFGNPSSAHGFGAAPRAALEVARDRVRGLIGARAGRVVFTGTGSEADALAVGGVVAAARAAGRVSPHVVTQVSEHPAVLAAVEAASRRLGARVTVLGVGTDGLVRPDELRSALTADTVLVSIMHANNETGVIQPVAELAGIAHESGALFHTDAAQSVGKISVDVARLGVDLLTLVGHKMYAPKGVAALYLRDEGLRLEPVVGGGGQEGGLRAGTENVPYAVGLGEAAVLAREELASGGPERLARLRDLLHARLDAALPGRVELNGHPEQRLPHVLNVSIEGIRSHELLERCTGLAASAGSACHAGLHTPSPVLTAMGLPADRGLSAVRLTLGRWTTEGDVTRAADILTRAVAAG